MPTPLLYCTHITSEPQVFPLHELETSLGHCKRIKRRRDDGVLLVILCPVGTVPTTSLPAGGGAAAGETLGQDVVAAVTGFLAQREVPVDGCLGALRVVISSPQHQQTTTLVAKTRQK